MKFLRLVPLVLLGLSACAAPSAQPAATEPVARGASVKPGINDDFLAAELDVERYVQRFEGESREIYAQRAAIVDLVGLRPGMRIADVGAGTGLFSFPFAARVGTAGKVYAVDIAPPFVERLRGLAAERGMPQVEALVCTEDDTQLPERSIDVAFVCDTYHHFEYPARTLASIHRALVPGGELIVIDFERIPGVSREWLLEHVRAGREVFESEIVAAGFESLPQAQIPGLKENYVLRFRRR